MAEAGISDSFNMMARAAKEAGLITGKTTSELQANLNKLMEQGKAISYDILPYFTKQLHEAARKNDALNYALHELFSVQLGRAKLQMQLFADEIWKGGFLEGMKELLSVFNEFKLISQPVARFIGVTLRNAITTIALPFRIFLQVLKDVAAAFGFVFDGDIATQIAKVVGTVGGIILFSAALGLVGRSLGLITSAFKLMFGVLMGGAAKGALGNLGKFSKLLTKVAAVAAIYEGFDLAKGVAEKIEGKEGAPSSSKLAGSGLKVAGTASMMSSNWYAKAAGAALYGTGMAFDRVAEIPLPQKPNIPSYLSGGSQSALYSNHLVNVVPREVNVNVKVKGADGLIDVVHEVSTEAATEAVNAKEEKSAWWRW